MRVFFTADTHLGHRRIPLYCRRAFCLDDGEKEELDRAWLAGTAQRGQGSWTPSWEAVSRMDDYLIDRINKVVSSKDILWHLGDFCFGRKDKLGTARRYRERIQCKTIYFTWGNHDDAAIAPIFTRTYERRDWKWQGQKIVLSHYAQAIWNKSHHGAWHLYGHSHGTAEDWLDKFMPGRRSIDVGVDNAYKVLGEYRPFSFEELAEIFKNRDGVSIDHHKTE